MLYHLKNKEMSDTDFAPVIQMVYLYSKAIGFNSKLPQVNGNGGNICP